MHFGVWLESQCVLGLQLGTRLQGRAKPNLCPRATNTSRLTSRRCARQLMLPKINLAAVRAIAVRRKSTKCSPKNSLSQPISLQALNSAKETPTMNREREIATSASAATSVRVCLCMRLSKIVGACRVRSATPPARGGRKARSERTRPGTWRGTTCTTERKLR